LVDRFYEKYLFSIYAVYAGLMSSHVIKKHGLEVIIERETSFGAGGVASFLTGRPMVLEIIGPRYSRFSLKKAKKILAYTKSMILDPVSPEKLVLVTAAADIESFKSNTNWKNVIRDRYHLQGYTVVGYIGTFARWHGLEELVVASLNIVQQYTNVRFLMVGPYFSAIKRFTEKYGVSSRYIFTGPVPYSEVPKYINAADILVAPYNPAKSELRRKYGIGSPLKVFEYMACKKPIVTTSLEPITQVVRNGQTGILVPPGDSESLSKAIIYLIQNVEIRDGTRLKRVILGKHSQNS
jgi:glycosyltransferase involved in cell wall biosynthesis